jgi:nitric oxide synthase oxygenase domain/subunit
MIVDVKMEDFRRKARFVTDGHTTDTPHAMIYANVVSRESVRVTMTLAALNDLDVKMADIENAYLTAPITEKVWTVLGPESGDDAGKRALIVRALYGLKSAGAAFSNHLAECMKHLGWNPCRADRDLLMKAETRPDDGVLYWVYILIYVDDILCVHHDPGAPLEKFRWAEHSVVQVVD